jgi:hypothetical protein
MNTNTLTTTGNMALDELLARDPEARAAHEAIVDRARQAARTELEEERGMLIRAVTELAEQHGYVLRKEDGAFTLVAIYPAMLCCSVQYRLGPMYG